MLVTVFFQQIKTRRTAAASLTEIVASAFLIFFEKTSGILKHKTTIQITDDSDWFCQLTSSSKLAPQLHLQFR